MRQNYLSLILIGTFATMSGRAAPSAAQDSTVSVAGPSTVAAVRRLANTARLAAGEYALGVAGGRVVLAPEVEEATLFLAEARRTAERLPSHHAGPVVLELERLEALISSVAAPDSVSAGVERLLSGLARTFRVELDEIPSVVPSLARGAEIYREACADCHGVVGRGDGPAAAGLEPAPSDLSDRDGLRTVSPLDFYRRVTIGVAGTAMPPFETTYSVEDRWAVALFASTLRLPPPEGRVPSTLADFATSARLSDADLHDALGGDGSDGRVAAARILAGADPRRDYGRVFRTVRAGLDSAVILAQEGDAAHAEDQALDAYMAFEAVERELRVKEPALVTTLERQFGDLRGAVATTADVVPVRASLEQSLHRAERVLGSTLSPVALFAQSLLILVREGLEAILVVGALMAFLVKLGAGDRRRDLHLGVGTALGMSVITAILIETVFRLSPAHQEALEAVTMVLATGMLFWVSYWLLSKIEVARWNRFVRSRLSDALGRKSRFALASVAFLAVYREGFETVLFYKALVVSGGDGPVGMPVGAGIALGVLLLALVYVAINRYGVRLPLRPFFAVTSAFLYLMAFNFAGTAIAELQEGGFLSLTPIAWLPRVPALGMYPTVESAVVQALLLALAGLAVVWTFVVNPRRTATAV